MAKKRARSRARKWRITVVARTDNRGSLSYFARYKAYGTRFHEVGGTYDRQRGNTKDEESPLGLLNEGMRWRDLEHGGWLTPDPIRFADGPNRYLYVQCNPISQFDPLGLSMKENAKSWGLYGIACYKLLNAVSLGVLDRNNTRQEKFERGEISYKQMATGCAVDGATNIASRPYYPCEQGRDSINE